MNNKNYLDKSYNGLLILKAKNGNFNAGFDGNPRTLPDGTIFATDKALKYCIREYLYLFENQNIFVRRNRYFKNDKKRTKVFSYQTLEENFKTKLETLKKQGFFQDIKFEDLIKKDKSKTETHNEDKILEILKNFIDIRLFGVVFSVGSNISLTGPVQISYGINKLENSSIYPVQILSPYKNSNEKSESSNQTTIGEETKVDEVYYVFNISVNSANAKNTGLTYEDLEKLKEALLKSVDPITSCTKFGCESIALIWLNNERNLVLNNLDDFIKLTKRRDEIPKLDLEKLKDYLKQFGFKDVVYTEFNYNLDLKEKEENLNKIEVIYKKGKIKF